MRHSNRMIRLIMILTLVAVLLLTSSVFFVSVAKIHLRSNTDLSAYADSANTVSKVTKATRGNIYDRSKTVIAQDVRTYNIYCVLDSSRPSIEGTIAYVQDKEYTAEVLAEILKTDKDTILQYLNQDVYQTELGNIGRNLSKETKEKIAAYDLPGIEFTDSIERVYPLGTFASNLIGFAQTDESGSTVGKMGAELYLDSYLEGTDGYRTYQADKDGYILPGMREDVTSAINGNDVYLTLDETIQEALEAAFLSTENKFDASRIWGAVMEINTGKILAWGQYPSFDPNTLEITDYNNYGTQTPYEPGSTMKSITWAAAINEGNYDGSASVYGGDFCYSSGTDNNPYRVSSGGYGCITNASNRNFGTTDYDHGLIYSANTIASSIETEIISPDILLSYIKAFGFFDTVDTDGLPEEEGVLNFTWPRDKLTLSFGQGSTVTMLQMLQAYSAIFGNGEMVRPYYVEKIASSYDSSDVVYQAERKVTGTPITEETAKQLQGILYRVINDADGTGRFYQIPECELIGKTGTTQVTVNGNVLSGYTIASLMAAMPADDPQVLIYYCFEAPYNKDAHYYSDSITTFLRKVAMAEGFTASSSTEAAQQTEDGEEQTEANASIETYDMPNLINHSISYAAQKMDGTETQLIILGDGSTVIDQYPREGSKVTSSQRVFLLTDTNSFIMPDMTGWTRKDVAALWSVTGFGFKLSGQGKVTGQSVPAGATVTKDTEIEVVFE